MRSLPHIYLTMKPKQRVNRAALDFQKRYREIQS